MLLRLPKPRCGGDCQHPCPSPSRLSGLFGVRGALAGDAAAAAANYQNGLPMAALHDNPLNRPPPYCTEFGNGDFWPWGGTYMCVGVLRNGPRCGRCCFLIGLYLLFICPTCLVIALEPRRAQILPLLPPLALACAASVSCVMGHGEWLCCCGICCWCSPEAKKIWLCATSTSTHAAAGAAAFSPRLLLVRLRSVLPCLLGGPAALVAAPHVPTAPMFLFQRDLVLRNTNSCFTCSLFKQKALH